MIDLYLKLLRTVTRNSYSGNSIFIFGVPRGGTTWFAEYLINQLRSIDVYEPFGIYNPKVKAAGYRRFEYFKDNDQKNLIFKYVKSLINGHFNKHLIKPKDLWRLPFRNNLVLKFIKGSSLINDLAERFPDEKFILLLRNPIAVIASQLKYGNLEQFYAQDFFDNPSLKTVVFNNTNLSLPTPIHILAYTYGLNYTYLEAADLKSNVNIVCYEEVLKEPQKSIEKIGKFLKRPLYYDSELFFKKSSSTYSGLSGERKEFDLSQEQKSIIQDVLLSMGITVYNTSGEFNLRYFE